MIHPLPSSNPGYALSLDGNWDHRIDPQAQWTQKTLPHGAWGPLPIPSNWNRVGLDNYSGVCWFRRTFHIDSLEGLAGARLRFHGVDYYCDVWLNGVHLGEHEGYFQPFDFSVRSHLSEGDNEVLVRVDSPREPTGPQAWPTHKRLIKGVLNHHDCRPGGSDPAHGQDHSTGGIWNSVSLELFETVELSPVHLETSLVGESASVSVSHTLYNHASDPITLELALSLRPHNFTSLESPIEQTERVTLQPGSNLFETNLYVSDPQLWQPWDQGTPHLYLYDVKALCQHGSFQFQQEILGIRSIALDEKSQFTINGHPTFIRGTNIIPTQWLADYDSHTIQRDVRLLKEANINCVRVHGHVQREEFYRACDEAGIMVWCDFALQWGYVDDEPFRASVLRQAREWVQLLTNRASIIAWCCHNEPTHNRHTLGPVLANLVRREDPSRPVIEASDFRQHAYPGWYAGHTRDFAGLPGAPLITEYGAQALPSRQALEAMLPENAHWPESAEQWKAWTFRNFQPDQTFNVANIERGENLDTFVSNSQRYQADLLKLATESYRANKGSGVTGIFQFMFIDCWPSITWSILDHTRRPKLGYHTLRKSLQPVVPSFLGGWLPRNCLEIGSPWTLATVFNVSLINDINRSIDNARLSVEVELDTLERIPLYEIAVDLPPNSVTQPLDVTQILEGGFAHPELPQTILETIVAQVPPGEHKLVAALHDEHGAFISENDFAVSWVLPKAPVASAFITAPSASDSAEATS